MFNNVNGKSPGKVPSIHETWEVQESLKTDLKILEQKLTEAKDEDEYWDIENEIENIKHDLVLLEAYFCVLN